MLPDTQREPARYVAGVPAPSVITLNGVAAMEALNYFLLAIMGLHTDEAPISSVVHLPRDRDRALQDHRQDPHCRWCTPAGKLATGSGGDVVTDPHAENPRT